MTLIRFDDVRRWVFDEALPFWAHVGFDGEGRGFVEHLDLNGRPANVPFKRVRAQARQVYVYSHAAILDWSGPALDRAKAGFTFLRDHAQRPDGGWARTVTRDGAVLDETADLYDNAFVVFALAWLHRATGDAEPLELANHTLDFIDSHMRHESGGFHNWLPPSGPRQQNPHMHLFEALLTLFQVTGNNGYLERADRIARLFDAKFYDSDSRTLAEFFEDDWRRAKGEAGRIIEPGHQFEWCWLLHHFSAVCGKDYRSQAQGLYEFAEAFGVDAASGLARDQVRDDGAPLDLDSRLWPQTERLKANLALFEFEATDTLDRVAQSTSALLDRYLAVEPRGAWDDHKRSDGTSKAEKIPSSSFYHVLLAFAELLRLRPALEKAEQARRPIASERPR